jgi:tetratricopeptide (TPR) repeat protein
MRPLRPLLLAALLLAAAAPVAAVPEISEAEAKVRQEAAKAILAFAREATAAGARAAATTACAEARELDHLASGLAAAEAAAAALTDEGDAAALEKARKGPGRDVAKAYDRLASLLRDPKEIARAEDYLLRALRWEPAAPRLKAVAAAAGAASEGGRPVEAALLARGLLRADPEGAAKGKHDAVLDRLAAKDPFVLGSASHDLVAWVSLPKGWKRGGKYPVLVAVDGAGCGFLGAAKNFSGARGSRPFLVISPMTLSNTNTLDPAKYPAYPKALLERWNGDRFTFDYGGMEAILAEARRRFGAEEKVFVTGFSGGGNYCYGKLLRDPGGVRGAAPACANFAGMGAEGAPGAGAGGGPPVHILTGEKDEHREFTFGKKDSPGIEPQTDRAVEVLQGLGYGNVRRTMVKGAGHSSLSAEVWKFVDEVVGK